ncbi:alpha/beta hydrolase family protein [Coralloluteibacterium stylophorae]|uniref:Prolyl oligopeptidase family serine peptidase n=1 Tax=Coralloluteibacterium stylophorae TaxID=1776034 RepID=A0A8J8AX73_9GAMM|nr:prolyl oligopeptidase family serine peptidase [Coralloluteibacterium stylophorae]MBS7456003.1 prolyl oligopeptidase family serine peptidase [Coralloluteibacterium stylophorae]
MHTRRDLLALMFAAPLGTALGIDLASASSGSGVRRAGAIAPRSSLLPLLGDMPRRPTPAWRVLETVPVEGGTRALIEYLAEPAGVLGQPEDRVRAWLFRPPLGRGARRPAILAIHQDGAHTHIGKAEPAGLAGDAQFFQGLDLFRRGYVVLCPDRFYHAERRRRPDNGPDAIDPARDEALLGHRLGQLLMAGRTGFGKEAYDLMVAVDVLAAMPEVDAARIGAIGHSAGGNALIYAMCCDPRIACGVSSCGFFGLEAFFDEHAPRPRSPLGALPGLLRVGTTADFLAAIAPRPMLLTRGLWEWGGDDATQRGWSRAHVADTRAIEAHARPAWGPHGDRLDVRYFAEGGGAHALPPGERAHAYAWLDRQLAAPSPA